MRLGRGFELFVYSDPLEIDLRVLVFHFCYLFSSVVNVHLCIVEISNGSFDSALLMPVMKYFCIMNRREGLLWFDSSRLNNCAEVLKRKCKAFLDRSGLKVNGC